MFLLFAVGNNRYAIDVHQIAEVLPLVRITEIPHLPNGLIGVLNYHGQPLPIIDLSVLIDSRPTLCRLSTRLIVVEYSTGEGRQRLLGLIAEHVTTTFHAETRDFVDSDPNQALRLRPMMADSSGVVQRIDVANVLSPAIRHRLDAGGLV